jgi:uncharacterized protein with ParB-like and HNH nuclease domain
MRDREGNLDYRDRNINIDNINVMEFIRTLAVGEFRIPTFQRLFVWDPAHIVNLWDSMYHCYPIRSILCWKTHIRLHVHRRIGGFYIPENGSCEGDVQSYILDGQQRATSLLASFLGGTGRVREQSAFDYTLYFDLTTASFFFEKDYYKHRWDAEAPFLVRVREVPELPADHMQKLAVVSGFSKTVEKNLEQLKYLFSNYSIPLICLQGFDIAGVCAVYERINQTGVKLKNMDILIARCFQDNPTVIEEDFPS